MNAHAGIREGHDSDNAAVMAGFTRNVRCDTSRGESLYLLIRPDADLDSYLRAWDTDAQEWVRVVGWACTFTDITADDV